MKKTNHIDKIVNDALALTACAADQVDAEYIRVPYAVVLDMGHVTGPDFHTAFQADYSVPFPVRAFASHYTMLFHSKHRQMGEHTQWRDNATTVVQLPWSDNKFAMLCALAERPDASTTTRLVRDIIAYIKSNRVA